VHTNNIIHRDIKPDNILLSCETDSVKIADFGVSQFVDENHDQVTTSAGTHAFMPPELCVVFRDEVPPPGRPGDVWALGCTFYFLVFGVYPFVGENMSDLYDKIVNQHLTFPTNISVSNSFKDLLSKMLAKDSQGFQKSRELHKKSKSIQRNVGVLHT